ncbi:MAG: tetratricopeptide repeat protein [Gemmatimonadota bacterium]|nr:tetratricopeptide repeat protein [Gemmatimonadota bacterium]
MSHVQKIFEEIRRRSIWQVLGLYVAGSWVVLQVADVFVQQLFLPGWVFRGALVLLAIGLPILLATSFLQGSRTHARLGDVGEEDRDAGASDAGPNSVLTGLFTWRRALSAGVAAFALLGLGTGGYLASRAFGIGPAATLVDVGLIESQGRVLVADFDSPTGDSALAHLASEALRIDLSQSSVVRVADPLQIAEALGRTGRPRDAVLDVDLATELAVREGIEAVVAGEVSVVGGRPIITAELVSAGDGAVLVTRRETAGREDEFVEAIDRLSAALRERIGDQVGSIRADPPLERATTSSLEALRLFTQATRMIDFEARNEQAIPLLEEAVRVDTSFALAWRKLARAQENIGYPLRIRLPAYTRAFELRDRLTTRERLLAEATYHDGVTRDWEQALVAYEAMLELDPDDYYALNNGSQHLLRLGQPARAEEWASRAIAVEPRNRFSYQALAAAQVRQGKFDEAARTFEAMATVLPDVPNFEILGAQLAYARGDYDEAERRLREFRDADPSIPTGHTWLERLARLRGRLAEAERYATDSRAAQEARGAVRYPIGTLAVRLANLDAVVRQDPAAAARRLDRAIGQEPVRLHEPGQSFFSLVRLYGAAGRSEEARTYLEATIDNTPPDRLNETAVMEAEVRILWGEGRNDEALDLARRAEGVPCVDLCWLTARSYFRAGQADSAISYMERAVTMPWLGGEGEDAWYRPLFYERLGRLHDDRGDLEKAAEYYARFAELWAGADEELQPRVRAVQTRLEEILAERG